MMRGGLALTILVLIVIAGYANIVAAQVDTDSLEEGVDSVRDSAERAKEGIDGVKKLTQEDKWKFLSEKWNDFLSKNKYFAGFDSFMTKISIFFVILMGVQYEFFPTFFVVVALWVFFLWAFYSFMAAYFPLRKFVSLIVSLGMVIILAQLKFFRFMADILLNVFLWGGGAWRWISFVIFVGGFIFVIALLKYMKQKIEESHEKEEKLKETYNRKNIERMAEAMRGER